MKLKSIFPVCIVALALATTSTVVYAQPGANQAVATADELNSIIASIEKSPDNLELHGQYLKASGFTKWGSAEDPVFVKQYETWMKKFPKSAVIQYAMGHAFAGKESPKAKPYLLKAVAIDPKFDKAYFDLWIDGERWGDFEVSRAYLKKAMEAAPENADYAFYYANGFDETDFNKYRTLSLKVAKDFPTSERGAQALYWLGNKTPSIKEKISIYEEQKNKFPVNKYRWTASGMSSYYDLLLDVDTKKAKALAMEMVATAADDKFKKTWEANSNQATEIIQVQTLLDQNKASEAVALLSTIPVPKKGDAKWIMVLLKSKAYAKSNQVKMAYDSLLSYYASEPSAAYKKAIEGYGKQMGKSAQDIEKDTWVLRNTKSVQASSFNLETYLTEGKASLNDYKGKVILLTYWFPGCGPCRGEFPHFESVVKQFKGKDFVYLGINIEESQDDYVVPFMKSSGYSFIPLKDNKDWVKGPLDNRGAAPMNFLIDQDGKIIFENFRTNHDNQATLTNMIQSVLDNKK